MVRKGKRKEKSNLKANPPPFPATIATPLCRLWHDAQAIACAHTVTHANQEKGGLGRR